MNEHEDEPVWGLPDYLPDGEFIVWQGQPDWRRVAIEIFHVRKIAVYFLLLVAAHVGFQLTGGQSALMAAQGSLFLVLLGGSGLLILGILARLYARTTIYTMTNRRLVLRFGVALPMMINIPWHKVDAAGLVRRTDKTGDILLTLARGEKMSYWMLWPHARPWRFSPVQPALRCLPDLATAGERLQSSITGQADAAVSSIDGNGADAAVGRATAQVARPERDTRHAAGPRTAAYS